MNLNFYKLNAPPGNLMAQPIKTPLGLNAPKSNRLYGLSAYEEEEDFCIHDAH